MTSRHHLLISAGALLASAMSSQAIAQDAEFDGFYIGATIGGALQGDDARETLVFDRNLDGTFGDTVVFTTGVNAFAPGFCGGRALIL